MLKTLSTDRPFLATEQAKPGRPRAQDADRHIAGKMRERRVMLGLTQQQLAELIGVSYQQAHKYETGINRISAGRLFQLAKALDVEVGYFFSDMEAKPVSKPPQQQRMLLELTRNFIGLSSYHQKAICELARVFATGTTEDDGQGLETGQDVVPSLVTAAPS